MRFRRPFDPMPFKIAMGFLAVILGMLAFWSIWGFPAPWNGRGIGQTAECAVFDYGCARYLPPSRQNTIKPR